MSCYLQKDSPINFWNVILSKFVCSQFRNSNLSITVLKPIELWWLVPKCSPTITCPVFFPREDQVLLQKTPNKFRPIQALIGYVPQSQLNVECPGSYRKYSWTWRAITEFTLNVLVSFIHLFYFKILIMSIKMMCQLTECLDADP